MKVSTIDARGLERDLQAAVRGEVRFDEGSRALYTSDASNYRQVPIGVVLPRDAGDVVEAVNICHRYGAPVLSRGGGTSLAGQCCNVAVIIDTSKYMNSILELNARERWARVQPGLILDDLRNAAEQYHLTFGPDPATHNRCTLGGMIGNNSCGVHALIAGKTAENIEELEILTYDGLRMRVGKTSEEEIARIIAAGERRGEMYAQLKALRDTYADLIRERYPRIPRRVSGYNLDQLLPENGFHVARALVGSESTCVTVLEAKVRLVESPPARVLVVLGYVDVYTGCDQIPDLLKWKPIGLEGFDHNLIDDLRKKGLHPSEVALFPPGKGWLIVEFGGQNKGEAKEQAQRFMDSLKSTKQAPQMRLFDDPSQQAMIWSVRESAPGATAIVPGENPSWPGWEDSAVPPDKLGNYLRDLRRLLDRYEYRCCFYGHFGQGCLHGRINFDLETRAGIAHFRAFMNPGKMVNAYRVDENLRLGTNYHPLPAKTHFQYSDDEGSFANATLRCVGVGKCRRMEGGTMCPSFMVTREEADTTRGRAHLLFEMLQGNPLQGGWRSEHVREALDLCLACKGCKGDCPVNVDMATYKAEFLAHYYDGRLRPRTGYSMGLIYWWARLAARMPGVANLLAQTPVLSATVKKLAGVAPQRQMPAFAPQTFKQWFRQRGLKNSGCPQVILWPDTFNNHFHPETAQAAVEVLEAASYQVTVPELSLCCGRPLYDYGFLDLAKGLLREILEVLRPQIEAGIPVIGLEPSCAAVFRDELQNLFPQDADAKRLASQTYLLSEFLEQKAPQYAVPHLRRKALVHGHCHHKTIMKMRDEQAVLEKMGLDFQILDSGCCGMAGAFGFEKDHYPVSIKVGERVLLPAVRQADKETLIIADGFSCREQIAQTTDRRALHLAQVLQIALREGQHPEAGAYPEARYTSSNAERSQQSQKNLLPIALAGGGLALLGGMLAWFWKRRTAHPAHEAELDHLARKEGR